MCGIIGYTGKRNAAKILIEGLKALEYRGYDSAGIAVSNGQINQFRKLGKVEELEKILPKNLPNTIGIGHTRWATHGAVEIRNAHPHLSANRSIAIVHNGVIDNADELRGFLAKKNFSFKSNTDSEVIAHLIQLYSKSSIRDGFFKAISALTGTYGVAAISIGNPNTIYVAKNGSPLIIGAGENENFVASDSSALVRYINRVIYLEDGQIARITPTDIELFEAPHKKITPSIEQIDDVLEPPTKAGFEHYMLKEIWEQPSAINRCFAGRIRENTCLLGGFNLTNQQLANVSQVIILACGTSYHAGLIAKQNIESLAEIPCSVEIASEYYTRKFIPDKSAIYLVISQSGETYDSLECVKELKTKGCSVFGVINTVGSSIARECGAGVYIHAGAEVSVASTKAFTSQLAALNMFAVMLARANKITPQRGSQLATELKKIPSKINEFLGDNLNIAALDKLVKTLVKAKYVLFLGRGTNYPVAKEAALKLKEIAYIPCEAYPAAEMKHGPIAMIEKGTPVIMVVSSGNDIGDIAANIEEVRARGAEVYLITDATYPKLNREDAIYVPKTLQEWSAMVNIVPLQLLAYLCAVELGRDVDRPKNLAKSVTTK